MKKDKKILAENAIRKIAQRDGVSVEYVRTQMKIAMLSGMCSGDPAVKARWADIPCEGEVPTPEELIMHFAEKYKRK